MNCAVTLNKKVELKAKQLTSQVSLQNAEALRKQKKAENLRRWRENRSQAKKEADKAKRNAANAEKKEGMSEEEKRMFDEANRLAIARCRDNKTEEQKEDVRRSDRIRKQLEKEAMDEDELALMLERNRARVETHRRSKKSTVTLQDGLRNKEILKGSFPVAKLEDTRDAIGKMDVKCRECGAFKFRRETPGFCCSEGKVMVKPFPRPPEDIAKLWISKKSH